MFFKEGCSKHRQFNCDTNSAVRVCNLVKDSDAELEHSPELNSEECLNSDLEQVIRSKVQVSAKVKLPANCNQSKPTLRMSLQNVQRALLGCRLNKGFLAATPFDLSFIEDSLL